MDKRICRVRLLDLPFQVDKPFDYFLPFFDENTKPGALVAVPFGGGNNTKIAVITELCELSADIDITKLKPVHRVIYPEFSLREDMLALAQFMHEQTLCSFGEAVKAILPVSSFSKLSDAYYIKKEENAPDSPIINIVKKRPGITENELTKLAGESAKREANRLYEEGFLKKEIIVSDKNRKYNEIISLKIEKSRLSNILHGKERVGSKKRKAVIEYLAERGKVSFEQLKDDLSVTRTQICTMQELGYISIEKTDNYRAPYNFEKSEKESFTLSDEQQKASDTLKSLCDTGKPNAALLFGVTGSGKTQVIKSVIDHVIQSGRGAIMLVPEISLTPQTMSLFSSWYGERIAVLHSALSAGERFDAWRKIKNGLVDVCIGTRSAVFAPFEKLGVIILDEEQEHTYKSDQNPKYHARDIARFRCASSNALMLLSSATPSLESYYRAKSGRYNLVTLPSRYGSAELPETIIADMRLDAQEGRTGPVGDNLANNIKSNLSLGEQTILFVNRRGYNNYLSCNMCGYVEKCPHCSVSLTYHAYSRYKKTEGENQGAAHAKQGYLVCHYCGYREPVPEKCPECSNVQMQFMGFGTQLVENNLRDDFPDAKITRMDADTTQSKFAYDEIIENFKSGESDILLGTQMVTKGHDFPDVTLVGVISADASLYLDDFRANEQTFSLVTQVVGRAGRAAKKGRAVIQTYSPDHPVLKYAAKQDYESFYKDEIALRRALVFPPFCDMVLFMFSSRFEQEAQNAARIFAEKMKNNIKGEYNDVKLQAFGPFEAPIYKKQDMYRMRIVVKCVANGRTRSLFAKLLREFSSQSKTTISIDINPSGL